MEKVLFGGGVGQGLIMDHDENPEDFIASESVVVNGKVIEPNTMTSLSSFFKHEIKYVGILKDEKTKVMCFYLGKDENTMFPKHYYDCYHLINDKRLFSKYTEKSGRDFNYINNKWK